MGYVPAPQDPLFGGEYAPLEERTSKAGGRRLALITKATLYHGMKLSLPILGGLLLPSLPAAALTPCVRVILATHSHPFIKKGITTVLQYTINELFDRLLKPSDEESTKLLKAKIQALEEEVAALQRERTSS